MDTDPPKRPHDQKLVARERVPVAKTTRTQAALIVVAAVIFAAAIAALASAIVVSRQAAEREARVFGGTSANAVHDSQPAYRSDARRVTPPSERVGSRTGLLRCAFNAFCDPLLMPVRP